MASFAGRPEPSSRNSVFARQGLVDDVGVIEAVEPAAAGRTFRVRCRYTDLAGGESVALNGACLTVRECGPSWFTAAAVTTTLDHFTFAAPSGNPVRG